MKPVFVQTTNVRNFHSMMALVEKRHGHDSFATASGRAGIGKTESGKYYATQTGSVYIETLGGWSELWMYQDILKGMGVRNQPKQRKPCFELILEISRDTPRTIILDEADRLSHKLLDAVRDLCKMMLVPWVLIGEESLPQLIGRDRRVWSRPCATMEFKPMEAPDIIGICKEATDEGLHMNAQVAAMIQQKTGGDIRLIEMIISNAEPISKTNHCKEITEEIAKKAMQRMSLDRRNAA